MRSAYKYLTTRSSRSTRVALQLLTVPSPARLPQFVAVLTKQMKDGGELADVFTQATSIFGFLNPMSWFQPQVTKHQSLRHTQPSLVLRRQEPCAGVLRASWPQP